MKLKDFLDNPEEIFVGAMWQFPLYWIASWWVLPAQLLCGILWRLGGVTGGNHLFRRIGCPLVICGATFLKFHEWTIFLAVPLMIWACPWSYGEESELYKFTFELTLDKAKANFLTRGILFIWYWAVYFAALLLGTWQSS